MTADKGVALVVMKKEDYIKQSEDYLTPLPIRRLLKTLPANRKPG